jgi:hypothetical protein
MLPFEFKAFHTPNADTKARSAPPSIAHLAG